jgi:hypothetical protein
MFSRSLAGILLTLLCAGCLQEGPTPMGVHLFHGQTLASPAIFKDRDDWLIRFHDRRIPASETRGTVSDLWLTSFDGSFQRKVVSDWSDYWPESGPWNAGDRYYMVDEHLVPTTGGMARVADLIRLGPTWDEEFRLEGIATYYRFTVPIGTLFAEPQPDQTCPGFPTLKNDCPQIMFYRPPPPGQVYPDLLLWNGEQVLLLGPDAGGFQVQVMGNGTVYFIRGETRTLTRFVRPLNLMESVRANVTRFMISGDEKYAAVVLAEPGKSGSLVLNLLDKTEIPLGRPNPSGGWRGFGQDKLYYDQNATLAADGTVSSPVEKHTLDLVTGADSFYTLPPPLESDGGSLERPNHDERLRFDGKGHGVFTGANDYEVRRVLMGPLYQPSFTKPDGDYLIYVPPAAATLFDTRTQGPLMFQNADDVTAPPAMITPPGLLAYAQEGAPYFFIENDSLLVFWAHLGRKNSDLYFADYATGGLPTNLRIMAESILSVSISAHSLFGIVNMSQQDAVGDLVLRNFDDGTEIRYAQAVSEATEKGPPDLPVAYTAYIIRGRADSARSGLWLTPLMPEAPDGGAQ